MAEYKSNLVGILELSEMELKITTFNFIGREAEKWWSRNLQ
jgi:hypothetical protein